MPTITGIVTKNGAPSIDRVVRAYRRDTGDLLAQCSTSNGLTIPGDPLYTQTSLVLNFDGVQGGLVATDASPNPKPVIFNGATRLDTQFAKFTRTGLFCAPMEGVTIASHPDFAFPGDFCLEAFLSPLSWPVTYNTFFTMGQYNSNGLMVQLMSNNVARCWVSGTMYDAPVPYPWKFNSSHFFKICRESGVVFVRINGLLQGQFNQSSSIPANTITLGHSTHTGGEFFYGGIGGLRLTKGAARNDNSIPSTRFPESSSSVAANYPLGLYTMEVGYTGEVDLVILEETTGLPDSISRIQVY